jgi:hypothetical protein
MRNTSLAIYYLFAWHLPTQPMPGWRFAYWLRRLLGIAQGYVLPIGLLQATLRDASIATTPGP